MDDHELLRYSRQIMLPEIDIEGQQRLAQATVLVIGLGGLGSPIALYLAAAGVGRLILNDHDNVDVSNLQRQIIHTDAALGTPKVESAAHAVTAINPLVEVETIKQETVARRTRGVAGPGRPWYSTGATTSPPVIWSTTPVGRRAQRLSPAPAIRWEGQVTLFDPSVPESPCYRCLYPEGDDAALNCAENGVIAPLVGVVGAMQAMEAVKAITRVGEPLIGQVLFYDARRADWRKFKLPKRRACPVCNS